MLPQRLPNETMQEYFKRTAEELGAKCIDGMWHITSGAKTSGLYSAWVMQLHYSNMPKRNQY
jgi:hypothetical protein